MNLNHSNYLGLVDFIKAIYPYAKTPTEKEGIAMWIDDLAEYDLLIILESIRRMQCKDIFFTYQNMLKKIRGVTKGREYAKLITNQEVWLRSKAAWEKQAKEDYERFFK